MLNRRKRISLDRVNDNHKKLIELLSRLDTLSRTHINILPVQEFFDKCLDFLIDMFDADCGMLIFLDHITGNLVVRALRADIEDDGSCPVVLDNSMANIVAEDVETYLAEGVAPGFLTRWGSLIPLFNVTVPLKVGEQMVGLLALGFREESFLAEEDLTSILPAASGYITLLLKHCQLQHETVARNLKFIQSLNKLMEAKDRCTHEHSIRVAEYSVLLGLRAGCDKVFIEHLRQASLLHDIGKIGVSDGILLKPTSLTDEEMIVVKKHPQIGADIIGNVESMKLLVPLVLYHHERYDGKGYPAGLKGEKIPLGARIISVADAYEAMTSCRPYRDAYTREEAIQILKSCAGTQFDPKMVSWMVEILADEKDAKGDSSMEKVHSGSG